jgi:hypothetical protein
LRDSCSVISRCSESATSSPFARVLDARGLRLDLLLEGREPSEQSERLTLPNALTIHSPSRDE